MVEAEVVLVAERATSSYSTPPSVSGCEVVVVIDDVLPGFLGGLILLNFA